MTLAAGLLLALASTVAINWGWFAQQAAADALPPLSPRRPLRALATLFRHRGWVAGFAGGVGGWVLYVIALRLAPLSLVQAVSAGGIAVIALLARTRGGRERAAVAVGVGGLALLGLSLTGGASEVSAGATWAAVAAWLAGSAVAAALAAGPGARLLAPGAGLGLAAGVLYAAGDVATKFAVAGGTRMALAPAVFAAHGLAFACVQLAFQRGGALATAGTASLLTNALPIAAALALFGERVPGGPLGAVRVVAFGCVVASAALLALRTSHGPDANAPAAARPPGAASPPPPAPVPAAAHARGE